MSEMHMPHEMKFEVELYLSVEDEALRRGISKADVIANALGLYFSMRDQKEHDEQYYLKEKDGSFYQLNIPDGPD